MSDLDERKDLINGEDLATDEELSAEGRYDPTEDDFADEWEDVDEDFSADDIIEDDDEAIKALEADIQAREAKAKELEEQSAEPEPEAEEESEVPVVPVEEKEPDLGETVAVATEAELRPMTDEERAEIEALETERSAMAGVESELQDITELNKFVQARKREKALKADPTLEPTEEEKKAAKAKAAEERKRKRAEENDIFANRYKAKTINAAVAQSDPIVYFYNAAVDHTGNIVLMNVFQVLQDRFLGKMIPQLWMAVAEASDRVLELNIANLIEQLKVCAEYPAYTFVISISTRFFTKPAVLEKLLALIDHPVDNLAMAFDCISLQNLGQAAKTGLGAIKAKGIKMLLDNTEKVSMSTLSEMDFDYIRIDSRYYELGNFKAEGFLRLLTQFAKEQGVPTVATFCDNEDMAEYMFYMGVDAVQGNVISRPQRTVPNAVSKITLLESMQQVTE